MFYIIAFEHANRSCYASEAVRVLLFPTGALKTGLNVFLLVHLLQTLCVGTSLAFAFMARFFLELKLH